MVKKITAERLENIALYYLERYSSSSANLRAVLERRVRKDVIRGAELPDEASEWISAVVKRMQDIGYVNDETYKETLINRLQSQGKSSRQIRMKLLEKGLSPDFATSEDDEYEQALIFIRKKKIGFHRKDKNAADLRKDLQKMALAGFSYSVIRKVLDIAGEEYMEE